MYDWTYEIHGELDASVVASLVQRAVAMTDTTNYGDDVVYELEFTVAPTANELTAASGLHLLRVLGDQVRIEGWRRLGNQILLDFGTLGSATEQEEATPFLPMTKVAVFVFAPGPIHSDLSVMIASGLAEVAAGICALALGRTVEHDSPLFDAMAETWPEAIARRGDTTILTLTRAGVGLDVFDREEDLLLRLQGSLLAYHAALQQTNGDVALMLFVTCIEALIAPRQEWGKDRVTTRFTSAVNGMCPDSVNRLLAHEKAPSAFNFRLRGALKRQQKDFLEAIYQARSLPTHAGLSLSRRGGLVPSIDSSGSHRVALLSDLARDCILAYLQAPRSFLIGHPGVDPKASAVSARP